jgi:hypothetical protein
VRLVGGEVSGIEASQRRRGLEQGHGGWTRVEAGGTALGDALERASEIGASEPSPCRVRGHAGSEDPSGLGVSPEVWPAPAQRQGLARADDVAVAGESECRGEHARARQATETRVREKQTGHGSRDRGSRGTAGAGGNHAIKAVPREPAGRALAKVEGQRWLAGACHEEKATSAEIARARMRDGQCERRGDGRVDGIASGLEHGDARASGLALDGGDHAASAAGAARTGGRERRRRLGGIGLTVSRCRRRCGDARSFRRGSGGTHARGGFEGPGPRASARQCRQQQRRASQRRGPREASTGRGESHASAGRTAGARRVESST